MPYRYHATPSSNLVGIYQNGLKQSRRGQVGKGVYFAYNQKQALDWGEELYGNVSMRVLRVNLSYLRKNGIEDIDDEQSLLKKNVPMKNIEILNNEKKWESLDDFAHKYRRSFGISENEANDYWNSRGIGSTSTSNT